MGKEFVRAILNGMFILALPALVVVTAIAVVAYRRRDGHSSPD